MTTVHVLLVGAGATGAQAAVALVDLLADVRLTVFDRRADRAHAVAARCGGSARAIDASSRGVAADVVLLCSPSASQPAQARRALAAGAAVVSLADGADDVGRVLALDAEARAAGLPVAVGAGFSPGLSCLLARHASTSFDHVEEVHIAKTGTGGPACARVHHAALSGRNLDWREGAWVNRRGGSGRQLAWFPDPIGAHDCYRAALGDTLLLQRAFPDAARLTARMSATRRDRLTAWLPMLRPPHADGGPGGLRVEVWGRRGLQPDVVVYGVAAHPAHAAGAVAAATVAALARGELPSAGVFGLAEATNVVGLLDNLDRLGVTCAVFEGAR